MATKAMMANAASPAAYLAALKGWRRKLAKEAVALNTRLGDPTKAAK